ncbi:MAG TPA: molybdopterin-dependent oxidoreductase [Thermomicrobiaceae bacterium]|nr:molybdopterin-dependent oxidoreductase [Thermomicrobiaceae bacterium]
MSSRTVNLALLAILTVDALSGVGSFLAGTPDQGWILWVHRIGGFTLLPLLVWKAVIAVRSYRKRGLSTATVLSGMLGVVFIASLLFGILWSTSGAPGAEVPVLGSLTGLGVHVALAFALLPLFLVHVVLRWRQMRLRRPDFASRRAALRYLALSAAGLAAWRASEAGSAVAGWSGTSRRYTGSREAASFQGNLFPATNWLTDLVPQIDPVTWRLRIYGAVPRETVIGWDELRAYPSSTSRAVLDCTGGWYTEQDWSGVPLSVVLERAGVDPAARSVVVCSATGYRRRYPLDEARRLLLGTGVAGEPLAPGHGAPVRLIAPGRRGYDWVKWVVAVEVSDAPGWLQSPLPLQ